VFFFFCNSCSTPCSAITKNINPASNLPFMPPIDLKAVLGQLLYDPKNPLLFNNGFFLYYFACFILLYYLFRKNLVVRKFIFCFFSLYFFYKASGYFVFMVIFSAIADYFISNRIYKEQNKQGKKAWLILSIVFNLGILIYFKYTNFFIRLSNEFLHAQFNPLNILLPVGISFYTFENLSYTIDVYRGEFRPVQKFSDYLLFLSFFPKLVMGPIVRASDFIPQINKPYYVSEADFSKGFYLIVSGLFKKLIISDYITVNFVNYIFDDPSRYTGLECLFFEQPGYDQVKPSAEIGFAYIIGLVDLRYKIRRAYNWSHHQLGKEGQEQQVVAEPAHRPELSAVHIDRITQVLERIK